MKVRTETLTTPLVILLLLPFFPSLRYIEPPHLILRKALIRGDVLPTVADDLAEFMAANLFHTSGFYLSGPEKREKVRGGCLGLSGG